MLAFVEQDWNTDTVNLPNEELVRAVMGYEERRFKQTLALGLRPAPREGGPSLLPRRSFPWTDDSCGRCIEDLLGRFAAAAHDKGSLSLEQLEEWQAMIDAAVSVGDFYYGIVCHLVTGARR